MKTEKCPCVRKNCERHGDCDACRTYHVKSKQNRPVACEKEKRGAVSPRWAKAMQK